MPQTSEDYQIFDIWAVCILWMVNLSIISDYCKKLNISFSLVPVYAMLCAFPVENVEIIEPYPNIEASALDCRLAIERHYYTPLAWCGAYGVDV